MENKDFPLIYRHKKTTHYRTNDGVVVRAFKVFNAIDVAIEYHQVRAVSIIIDYIAKYQNNWVSSFLFQGNLLGLMNQGVDMSKLF